LDINVFTAAMRTEFLKNMQAAAAPARVDEFVQIVPSTARIENYAWMTPAPGISEYVGHRRAGQIGQIKYSVFNKEYDATVTVQLRDVDDDQVGGYMLRVKDIAEKAKIFWGRLALKTLAAGKTTTCFDGTNFFLTTAHTLGGSKNTPPPTFGGGNNFLTFTSSFSADSLVHRFAMLVHSGSLKPLLYQDRKPAKFETDAGTPQSQKAKKADYWVDLEGAGAYGYWWDACLCEITNTPGLVDLFSCIDAVKHQFRGFTLPQALSTDDPERVHEQTEFTPATVTIVCSTGLEQLFNHALNEDRVGVSVAGSTAGITSNIYYKSAGLVTSGFMD